MLFAEAARRLGWCAKSRRYAQRDGLRVVRYGATNSSWVVTLSSFLTSWSTSGREADLDRCNATTRSGPTAGGRLGLKIIGTEGHDLKTPCVSCRSSDAGRIHADTGLYFCHSCKGLTPSTSAK